jgi:serine/threonine protein kinase
MIGSTLGHYQIVARVGAGGMGEVYRARDIRLGRDVAVKVLPEALAGDPGALARFEQEARAVASLSHPNILAIHDFGTEDGVRFAVTELLEGATLREKLESGPMPVRKALDYALQMARGLAAAHDRGVVHRDVKPDNVFVTSDGVVKILDFGLAKAQAPASTDSPTMMSPARLRQGYGEAGTEMGTVLGTVGYMSPEQVRAQAVDRRSDIFSFGCVLYEMLSGRRAFVRGTTVETMTAILNDDPPAFETLARPGSPAAPVPAALSRLVLHCLEKDPNERFQSARDLAFDLQSLASPSSSETAAPRVETRRFRGTAWLAVSILVAGSAAVAFLAGDWLGAGRSAANRVPGTEVRPLTFQPALELDPSLSPDGQSFVFSANYTGSEDIWVQRVGGQNPVNLTKECDKRDDSPAFSPTGDRIAYRTECGGGGIWVMGATGESPRRLTDFGYAPAWSPDGREIVVATDNRPQPYDANFTSQLWVVNVETGAKRLLFDGDAASPSWSPHGFRIAYWRQINGQRDIATVAATAPSPAQPAAQPVPVAVTDDAATDWSPAWSPDGNYIYFGSDRGGSLNLWRMAIDERTGKTRGLPEPVTLPAPWSGHYSISRDGSRIIYRTLASTDTVYRVSFDPEAGKTVGQAASIFGTSLVVTTPDVSPDGRSIVFATVGSHGDLFLVRSDGTSLTHLTDDPARDRRPVFSPDGARIAFYSNRSGKYEIWTTRPDGSEQVSLTSTLFVEALYPNWSPNGRAIVFPDTVDNHLLEFEWPPTDVRHQILPRPPEGEPAFWSYSWSPDASTLAGDFAAAARDEDRGLALYTFPTRQYQRLTRSGIVPLWLPDSRRLLYLDKGAIWLYDTTTRTAPVLVETGEGLPVTCFTVSRDGRVIYFVQEHSDGDIWLATFKK